MIKLTICLACYNGEKYLNEQVQSIVSSCVGFDFTLLIGVDPSIDNTSEIVSKWAEQRSSIKCIFYYESSGGAKENFSRLLVDAIKIDSDYYLLSDQDDIWLEDKVYESVRKIRKMELDFGNKRPLLVFSDAILVDQNLNVISSSFWKLNRIEPSDCSNLNKLLVYNVGQGCTFIFNKALLSKALPIPDMSIMHDWWLLLVASKFGCVGYVNSAMLLYRQHDNNVMGGGVRRNGIGFKFKRFFLNRRAYAENLSLTFLQASAFLDRYRKELSANDIFFIEKILSLSTTGYFKRFLFFFENILLFKGLYLKLVMFFIIVFMLEQRFLNR